MSSKLLDAGTVTQVVPWRLHEPPPEPDPQPMTFRSTEARGTDPPASAPADPQFEDEVSLDAPQAMGEPAMDHTECRAKVHHLEQELQRLTIEAMEEKRVAHQQGFEAGAAQEFAKWGDALSRTAKSLADLAALKPKLRLEVEEDAVRLSLAIARKVLRREAMMDPAAISGLLRVALEKVSARDVLRVRTAPQDAKDLSARLAGFGLPVQVEVHADPGLARGSLVLDTAQGHVDASIETQLMEIERGLADALERNRGK